MTLLQSFDANFIVRVRLSKDLETDTLYLVFKDRIPIVLGYTTDSSNLP